MSPDHLSTLDSATERIKELEGVLVAIRARASHARQARGGSWPEDVAARNGALETITVLINETLDPHQPWCRDENHSGPCISDPEDRGGDE